MAQYLSNCRTSETAIGGPFELGDSFLFGGTDSTPERSHTLTTAAGVGLYGMQRRDNDNERVISKGRRNRGHHNVKRDKH